MIVCRDVTGDRAFKYIREQLAIGISLSESLNNLPIERGRVFALVPVDTAEDILYQFDRDVLNLNTTAGVFNISHVSGVNSTKHFVLEEIYNELKSGQSRCCLFEHPGAAPYFPGIARSKMEYVHLGNEEMYFFFNSENSLLADLKEAVITSHTYIFLCALAKLATHPQARFTPFKEIDQTDLETFASRVDQFYVKAYEDGGFLKWTI